MPPQHYEVDQGINQKFGPKEKLFRRVYPAELNSKGEVQPPSISSVSFGKEVIGAPSVIRSEYATPEDALHPDCADQKDVSICTIYYITPEILPAGIVSGDKRVFDFAPHHVPLATCRAHSVIKSFIHGDVTREYVKPSSAVRDAFKIEFAKRLLPVEAKPSSHIPAAAEEKEPTASKS